LTQVGIEPCIFSRACPLCSDASSPSATARATPGTGAHNKPTGRSARQKGSAQVDRDQTAAEKGGQEPDK